ncbi:MAG: Crp/Fnr family transcriptional regulator [Chitinophagaceae bacterium]|nr:MAG: Crp/Fnr family transcriptional regulator [Chitinophagaceae bacterium]
MPLQQLQQFVSLIYPLKEKEWNAFAAIWSPLECRRKTILTAAGETERHLYFVLEGVQRAFYIGDDNKEATLVFTYPPSFAGVADSFLTQTPSHYFFETLTASRFLRTSYRQAEELMQQYPNIQKMVLNVTALALKGVLVRQAELQCFSAEEKFRTLLKRSPHVLQLIPHKYLASYLGIDPATFSKLLGSKKI